MFLLEVFVDMVEGLKGQNEFEVRDEMKEYYLTGRRWLLIMVSHTNITVLTCDTVSILRHGGFDVAPPWLHGVAKARLTVNPASKA